MKNLIICVTMLLVFATCKNNAEDVVAIQFKGYVNFVDSIAKFNEVYKSQVDTVNISDPNIPDAQETTITAHKSLFENSSKYSSDIISFYMLKSTIIDSMDKANCFTQEQRNEIQKAKKKFDKMVAEGALAN